MDEYYVSDFHPHHVGLGESPCGALLGPWTCKTASEIT